MISLPEPTGPCIWLDNSKTAFWVWLSEGLTTQPYRVVRLTNIALCKLAPLPPMCNALQKIQIKFNGGWAKPGPRNTEGECHPTCTWIVVDLLWPYKSSFSLLSRFLFFLGMEIEKSMREKPTTEWELCLLSSLLPPCSCGKGPVNIQVFSIYKVNAVLAE